DDIIFKRARHSISENERVLKANQVLKQNDIVSFGQLMNESHISLRDDYEVTGLELDTIVEAAWNQEGVLGARVTGAGFGGCAIAIVQNDQIDAFTEAVSQSYSDKIGYKADFYVASIGTGSIEL
ncbi:MAG: galactokinase, partial [Erysipelothrix sp.]|nr:galactokinase [Erysipelothrix sp.]